MACSCAKPLPWAKARQCLNLQVCLLQQGMLESPAAWLCIGRAAPGLKMV